MKAYTVLALVIAMLSLAMAVSAQQPGPTPSPAPAAGTAGAVTLDCPPPAGASAGTPGPGSTPTPSGSAVGTPQGAGQGSGLATMPSIGPVRRVEGQIKSIDSTRTNRIIEIGDVKLEVEPSTVILVACQAASTADLKEGARVKAAYEVKSNNRNVATVIEAK
jgi:hypothetical protein